MTRIKYQRLRPGMADAPEVCSVHRLVKHAEVAAKIDAEKLRRSAAPGSPDSMATAKACQQSGSWHIYIPTKGRAKTLRKKMRTPRP